MTNSAKLPLLSLVTVTLLVTIALLFIKPDGSQAVTSPLDSNSPSYILVEHAKNQPIHNTDSILKKLNKICETATISPTIELNAILEFKSFNPTTSPIQQSISVKGISSGAYSHISKTVIKGEWNSDSSYSWKDRKWPSILLSKEFCNDLGDVRIGSEIVLLGYPLDQEATPRCMRFAVSGIFDGSKEIHNVFISMKSARKLFTLKSNTSFVISCNDSANPLTLTKTLKDSLGKNYKVKLLPN